MRGVVGLSSFESVLQKIFSKLLDGVRKLLHNLVSLLLTSCLVGGEIDL